MIHSSSKRRSPRSHSLVSSHSADHPCPPDNTKANQHKTTMCQPRALCITPFPVHTRVGGGGINCSKLRPTPPEKSIPPENESRRLAFRFVVQAALDPRRRFQSSFFVILQVSTRAQRGKREQKEKGKPRRGRRY